MRLLNDDLKNIVKMFEVTIVNELKTIKANAIKFRDKEVFLKINKILSIRKKPSLIHFPSITVKDGKYYTNKESTEISIDRLLSQTTQFDFIKDILLHSNDFSIKVNSIITKVARLIDRKRLLQEFVGSDYDDDKYTTYANDSVDRIATMKKLVDSFDALYKILNKPEKSKIPIKDVFSCLNIIKDVTEYKVSREKRPERYLARAQNNKARENRQFYKEIKTIMKQNGLRQSEAIYRYIEEHANEGKACYIDKKTKELDEKWERKAFMKLSRKLGRCQRQM